MKNLTDKNPYDILGVSMNASKTAIRDAFVRHQNRGNREVREANDILVAPDKRLKVDIFTSEFTKTDVEPHPEVDWHSFVDIKQVTSDDAKRLAEAVVREVFGHPETLPQVPVFKGEVLVVSDEDLFAVQKPVKAKDEKPPKVLKDKRRINYSFIFVCLIIGLVIGGGIIILNGQKQSNQVVMVVTAEPTQFEIIAPLTNTLTVEQAQSITPTTNITVLEASTSIPFSFTSTSTQVLPTNTLIPPTLTVTLVPPTTNAIFSTQTPTRTPLPTLTTTQVLQYVITSNRPVNARSCPRTDCDVLKILQSGALFDVVEIVEGASVSGSVEWFRLSIQGQDAYVHSSLAQQRR